MQSSGVAAECPSAGSRASSESADSDDEDEATPDDCMMHQRHAGGATGVPVKGETRVGVTGHH